MKFKEYSRSIASPTLPKLTKFNSRQRLAVNYSRKFVILDHYIRAARNKAAVIPKGDSQERGTEDFDPQSDETDRRMLFINHWPSIEPRRVC